MNKVIFDIDQSQGRLGQAAIDNMIDDSADSISECLAPRPTLRPVLEKNCGKIKESC